MTVSAYWQDRLVAISRLFFEPSSNPPASFEALNKILLVFEFSSYPNREAAKQVPQLVIRLLEGGGLKAGPLFLKGLSGRTPSGGTFFRLFCPSPELENNAGKTVGAWRKKRRDFTYFSDFYNFTHYFTYLLMQTSKSSA